VKTASLIGSRHRLARLTGIVVILLVGSLEQSHGVVGYVNVAIRQGLNLITNPLDIDGTGTNNNANTFLGTNAPEGTCFYRFDPSTQNYLPAVTYLSGFGWCPVSRSLSDPILNLNPGEAFWIESPTGNWNFTFVGNVLQGTLINRLPANYSLKADMVPVGGRLETDLKFPPRLSDQVWKWTGASFDPSSFAGAWDPGQPTMAVAEGFILWRDPPQATQANWWVQNFQVNFAASVAPDGSSGGSQIQSIKLQDSEVILDIAGPTTSTYDIQFSADGISWSTIATGVKGKKWKTRYLGGTRGFYQLVSH